MVPKIYEPQILDDKIIIGDGEAFEVTKLLAQKEGIFVGTSSGAAAAAALQIARSMDHGTIVVILPDRGDRYLSTMQFRSICAKCPP
jgi:cysteine synthase B